MKKRCYQTSRSDYQGYGAKGIQVCPEWKSSYVAFRQWALANGYDDTLTIDRIIPDGNYAPSNCRWLSFIENSTSNRGGVATQLQWTAWGVTKSYKAWAKDERCVVSRSCLYNRVTVRNWPLEQALTAPPHFVPTSVPLLTTPSPPLPSPL